MNTRQPQFGLLDDPQQMPQQQGFNSQSVTPWLGVIADAAYGRPVGGQIQQISGRQQQARQFAQNARQQAMRAAENRRRADRSFNQRQQEFDYRRGRNERLDQSQIDLRQAQIDKYNREAQSAGRLGSYKSVKDRQQAQSSIRKEFNNMSKPFRTQASAYERIIATKPTGVGDMSLIFSYMRLLDPASTVREGEFATAEQTSGLARQYLNMYNRVVNGMRLTPEQRKMFKDQATAFYSDANERFQAMRGHYGRIAEHNDLDPSFITQDFAQGPATAAPQLPPGVTVRRIK
ncbi:MAG: hypothetical protein AAGD43_03365 [Pseudomonadota bacterium]